MAAVMNREHVIRYLEFYRTIDGEIKFYRQVIHDIETEYYMQGTCTLSDGLPKAKNRILNVTEELALNIPEEISNDLKTYNRDIERLQRLKTEILKEISRLNLQQKSIIFSRYVDGLKWEQVATRNHYSARQCKNIRNKAIENLARRFRSNRVISSYDLPNE